MFGNQGSNTGAKPSGMEMMLINMLKQMGIDPQEISRVAIDLQNAITSIDRNNTLILKQQRRIMREMNIPFEEDETDGPGKQLGNGNGGTDTGRDAA